MNLNDLATFSIIKTIQLVIIFASLGHNHLFTNGCEKIAIKYVSGTILTFSMVSQELLVVINLTMLSAHCAKPFWSTIP